MQYHYVVVYDDKTNQFSVDVDTTMSVFSEGEAFDPETQEWHNLDELMEADYVDYEELLAEKLGE